MIVHHGKTSPKRNRRDKKKKRVFLFFVRDWFLVCGFGLGL
jgi:hypothetical protein